MSKNIKILLLVLALGGYYFYSQSKQPQPAPEEVMEKQDTSVVEESEATESAEAAAEETYALEEIAEHATPEDCWFAIAGTVYDVSGFDATHPGEEAVYEGCGKDATELFETRPMGSNTPHSEKARGFLPNFEIGTLTE
ncbi:cytochrome b5 domain-containing protein [Patescibacteria group bacterium]